MSKDDTSPHSPEESLVDTIETTRRRLLSGLGAGAGLAATGSLGSARGWHEKGETSYHVH